MSETVKSLERRIDAKGECLNHSSDLTRGFERVTVFVDSKNTLVSLEYSEVERQCLIGLTKPQTSQLGSFHELAGRRGNEYK